MEPMTQRLMLMPFWACLVLAYTPVAIFAALGLRLSWRIERTNDNLMTTMARFSGAALVFVCAFLIGTLWSQTTAVVQGWQAEYRAAVELQRSAELVAGDQAGAIHDSVDEYLRTARDTETTKSVDTRAVWQGSDEAARAIADLGLTVDTIADGLQPDSAKNLRTSAEHLLQARNDRFDRALQPGVPLAILGVVLLLACTATLSLSMYPSGGQPWVKRMQVAVVVLVARLVQLPVYYLIGNGPVHSFVVALIPG